jgi:excisionase family DNA binding protein
MALGDAAEALGLSTSTLRRWADAGRVQAIRTSRGHRRFPTREVHRLRAARLAQHKPVVRSVAPPVEPLPALGELLTAAAADLVRACTHALYDGAHTGWFASPTGRQHVERWALAVAAGARTGDYDTTTAATRQLMLQASHTGASLLERYTMLERVGAIVLRDLQDCETDRSELLGARRLFLHLRQLVLEADDARG